MTASVGKRNPWPDRTAATDRAPASGGAEPTDRIFARIASCMATRTGQPGTFILAPGAIFDQAGTWQRVIGTGTTIVTFPMVIVIQTARNRDASAMQVRLGEPTPAARGNRAA